jgi:hypothetical protein
MNALTEVLHRPGRRLAKLDPFEPQESAARAGTEAEASYGCVDWYVYGESVQGSSTQCVRSATRALRQPRALALIP